MAVGCAPQLREGTPLVRMLGCRRMCLLGDFSPANQSPRTGMNIFAFSAKDGEPFSLKENIHPNLNRGLAIMDDKSVSAESASSVVRRGIRVPSHKRKAKEMTLSDQLTAGKKPQLQLHDEDILSTAEIMKQSRQDQ